MTVTSSQFASDSSLSWEKAPLIVINEYFILRNEVLVLHTTVHRAK
jgi:hypothetical protein